MHMGILPNMKECTGCSACYNICPSKAIKMEIREGFWYPYIEQDKCVKCNLCKNVCPVSMDESLPKSDDIEVYAGYNLNNDIRISSSSGGIFSVIAEKILSEGGVVFGAAFGSDFSTVEHIKVDEIQNLKKLRGSKYVQSNIKRCFKECKRYLENGQKVLFTGTPCQIAGLKKFLRKDYDDLFTIDFICHGVPSPIIWKEYVKEIYSNCKIKKVEFRNKLYGWENFLFCVEYENGDIIRISPTFEIYMQGFLNNLYLRESCYDCKFKTVKRCSEFTVGDCWGSDKICPEIDAYNGLSVLFVQNEKGKIFLQNILNDIKLVKVDTNLIVANNMAIVKSSVDNRNRRIFWKEYAKSLGNVSKLIKKYYFTRGMRKYISLYIRNKVKFILKELRRRYLL